MNADIALIYNENCTYPLKKNAFRPSVDYPENPFPENISQDFNVSYDSVRKAFQYLDLDTKNFGTDKWNPLGEYVKPGDCVAIKPNLVMHKNYRRGFATDTDCVYTHPSVTAAVIDYVIVALKGEGKIIVGDAPVQECNFDVLVEQSGYADLIRFYKEKGIAIELKDFRGLKSVSHYGVLHQSINVDAEYTIVHLDAYSEFTNSGSVNSENIRITNYNPAELLSHHCQSMHEYCVASDILNADVVINIPKPKTHKKAGITGALKNLVGINCRKEYLPHHTVGDASMQGDEYNRKSFFKAMRSRLHDFFCNAVSQKKYLAARCYQIFVLTLDGIIRHIFRDKTSWGSWYGNNTISKTIIDLNKILLFADKKGIIRVRPQRRMFTVADMIISGEHNGPMAPTSKNAGLIIAAEDPLGVDEVIAKIMGADADKIPTLVQARCSSNPLRIISCKGTDIRLVSNDLRWHNKKINEICDDGILYFKSPDDWETVFYRKDNV